ncbi:AraC family transcriptional regulator [Paenibacillus turicensis]|uniref:AraC family transcriptional regulator n=1 Tax=Paenibacillus turicensis TaxID=160487 RepID=UPI003D297552
MDYFSSIQKCVDYVDKHLDQEVDIDKVISQAHMSKFHFHRLFKAIVGITIHDYIKRRKLSEAAEHLYRTNDNVLMTAILYGFHSQEVFTRNFKKQFGYPPAQFKKLNPSNWRVNKTNKINIDALRMNIKAFNGKVVPQEKVEYISNLTLIGIERITTNDEGLTVTGAMQGFLCESKIIPHKVNDTIYRLCYDLDPSKGDQEEPLYRELIAVAVTEVTQVPDGMTTKCIQEAKVITYSHKGKLFTKEQNKIIDTYQFLYRYRIPYAEYELTSELLLERYGPDFKGPDHEDSVLEISFSIK